MYPSSYYPQFRDKVLVFKNFPSIHANHLKRCSFHSTVQNIPNILIHRLYALVEFEHLFSDFAWIERGYVKISTPLATGGKISLEIRKMEVNKLVNPFLMFQFAKEENVSILSNERHRPLANILKNVYFLFVMNKCVKVQCLVFWELYIYVLQKVGEWMYKY